MEAREPEAASVWHEVRADALANSEDTEQHRYALSAAARHATGVRRATLLRRLADAQLMAGQPDAAVVTLQPLGRVLHSRPLPQSLAVTQALSALRPHAADDDWATLSPQAALAAVDLARAEALSHLIQRDAAVAAFADVERSLQRLDCPAAAQLWVRWARAQTWFLCEVLGDAAAALEVCARVRQRVAPHSLSDAPQAIVLLRAEEVAASSLGDFERSRRLVEDQVTLAQRQKAPREECLAWNARALLHFAQGELGPAAEAFQRSLDLALTTRWARREAITTHNLALLATERLELERARELELHYQALSLQIGNPAAQVEAPLLLAAIELAAALPERAEPLISRALQMAEQAGWVMLLAQGHALRGRYHLHRFAVERISGQLEQAHAHLLAAIETLEQHSLAWSEELDPGEAYAQLAYALHRLGLATQATETLGRAQARIPAQSIVSQQALAVGRAAIEGEGLDSQLAWFEERGYRRLVAWWRRLTA